MTFLNTLVAQVVIALSTAPAPAGSELEAQRQDARYTMWSYACEYTPESCYGIDVPEVIYEPMFFGLRGYYKGEDVVYVNAFLPPAQSNATLMHEMIHYLHVQHEQLEVPAAMFHWKELCRSEDRAFSTVDRWLVDQNREKEVRGPNWWKAYWHCEPWYDPDFNLADWLTVGFGDNA